MGDSTFQVNGQRLRFVSSDASGLPVKRKQVQQACLACRLKKKKCTHGQQESDAVHSNPDTIREPKRPRLLDGTRTPLPGSSHAVVDEDTSTAASQLLGLSDSSPPDDARPQDPQGRFIGDLAPEGFLIEAAKSADRRGESTVGIWKQPVRSGTLNSSHSSPDDPRASILSPGTLQTEVARLEEALKTARNSWLERSLADIRPPDSAFAKLRDIYLAKIHPIFPIFASRRLRNLGSGRIDTAIRLSVCLAASTDHEAGDYLRLAAYPQPLSYHDYSSKVTCLLRTLIQEIDFSNRLLDQIRILACTSLYWQPQEEHEWDAPVRMFSQAMSIVHSIGLHLKVYDKMFLGDGDSDHQLGHRAQSDNCRQSDIERLFLCIYALDRMICTFYGRPVLLNERDFDKDILEYASRQTPCFRLFIHVIWELNEVIDLYRPSSTSTNKSSAVSVFERLILDSGAQNEPSHILATIEVLHHAVSALSVRQTREAFATYPDGPADNQKDYPHLPDPLLNARRSISADRILQIVKQYDVGPLPFVPYALSIALSVAYRKWRFSKIPMFRTRGRAGFMEVLSVLDTWGRIFTSARVSHNLAQKVVEGMEQVADNMKRKHRERSPVSSVADTSQALQGAIPREGTGTRGPGDHIPTATGGTVAGTATSGPSLIGQDPIRGAIAADREDLTYRTPSGMIPGIDPESDMDFSSLENMGSLDWFQLFDKNTNMDVSEMDGMFDRNLDPMAPAFWPDHPAWDADRAGGGSGTLY